MKVKYLILGAGPAGLTLANRLKQLGITDFLVIEKENEVGGLCRSLMVDGSELDIGGGHFLDIKRKETINFLFQFMPEEEWNLYERNSKIDMGDFIIDHPFEANIWQIPASERQKYIKSIANAGCNINDSKPNNFIDWITWKLGYEIANNYMIPYNSKLYGNNLNDLGTYWLEKLPNVSYEETLRSLENKKAYGTQPGHVQFYYPKNFGYGEVWRRMGNEIKENLRLNVSVEKIDFNTKTVFLSSNQQITADMIITTIPWTSFKIIGIDDNLRGKIKSLKFNSIVVNYSNEVLNTDAHWIYYPNEELDYHRILVRSNFLSNSKGYWTETNYDRFKPNNNFYYKNEYAYPLNSINKPEIIKKILAYSKEKGIIGFGRWGEWEHYNSDIVVMKALELADKIKNI